MIFTRFKNRTYQDGKCNIPNVITCKAEDGLAQQALQGFLVLYPNAVCVTDTNTECFIEFKNDTADKAKSEQYKLEISENKMTVYCQDERGGINGAATVALLLCNEEIQTGEIVDYPDCAYRSFMIDMARGLPSMADIKNTILSMALSKFNHLHLHLMDSKGICYKSNALSKLGCGVGGQFEIADIQEIIQLCQILKITIVPEIEMPAHAKAIVKAYPELACDTDTDCHWTVCPGVEATWVYYERLIQEVASIFPDEYIHIGSDELEFADLPKLNQLCFWDSCEACKQLREREGLADRQAQFYYVVNRMYDIVKQTGKKMMMWNDQIDVTKDVPLDRDILVEFWRVAEPGRGPYENCSMAGLLEKGFRVINADYPHTYCDLEEYMTPEKLHDWNPTVRPNVPDEYKQQIIGGEACAWEFGNLKNYPFYAVTAAPAIMLFGDKVWDFKDRTYTDGDRMLMAAYLFGVTPKNDILSCIGSLIPPREANRYTYVDSVPAQLINRCIEELQTCEKPHYEHNAKAFIQQLHKIADAQ